MPRPVPTQVVPRPATWRAGDRAPWVVVPARPHGIGVDHVLAALSAHGQRGPVPDDIGFDIADDLGSPVVVRESSAPHRAMRQCWRFSSRKPGRRGSILTRPGLPLRSHRGEVSFPGGRLDPGEDAPHAALREAHEEIALNPAQVSIEGWIHPVMTVVSASLITPLVATVPSRPHVVASPAEVERVFDVPLRDLGRPRDLPRRAVELPGAPGPRQPRWFLSRVVLRGGGRFDLGGDGPHDSMSSSASCSFRAG